MVMSESAPLSANLTRTPSQTRKAQKAQKAQEAQDALETAETEPTGPGPARDPQRAWRRLFLAGSPRRTRANILAMILAGTLGFAIIAQVRQTSIEGLENLREYVQIVVSASAPIYALPLWSPRQTARRNSMTTGQNASGASSHVK